MLYFRDYSHKMSRPTVAGLEAVVKEAALAVLERRGFGPEALLLETCGGYKRGKEWNGDADILVSYEGMGEGGKTLPQEIKQVLVEEMGMEVVDLRAGGGEV